MKIAALQHLSCLNCLSRLDLIDGHEFDEVHKDEVKTGTLKCTKCASTFPILRGVPRFVDATQSSAGDIETGQSFADAWKKFPFMDDRYRRQFFDWVFPVDEEFVKDKLVLECGCGKGRHASLLMEAGARAIFAVDIGEAIDVAYANVGHLPGVHLVQADIERLPFNADFDFAFSVGVLHHMVSPISGFLSMSKKVNESGSIVAWVYGRENNWWLISIVNPIRERITSKMPSNLLLILSAMLAWPLLIYCKLVAAPWAALKEKFPLTPPLYYGEYLSYIARFDFREIHHITFDHLIAPVANYVARGYFASWFDEAGWPDSVIRWHNRNSWTGFSSKKVELLELMRTRVKDEPRLEVGGGTARGYDRNKVDS